MIPLPVPGLPDECFGTIDHSCCPKWDDYSPEVQGRADSLAVQTLRGLTNYLVGGCPITVRPCVARCAPNGYLVASLPGAGVSSPHIAPGGAWVNSCGCPSSGCSCTTLSEVRLEGPVGFVNEVIVDGAVLDPSQYRIDNHVWLVRTDGGTWPTCQDMAAPSDGPGAFAVTYLNAFLVDSLGLYVAGILACEYAKACTGNTCRLPAGVQEVTRQGVRYTVVSDLFSSGTTGIREVDDYVHIYNPHRATGHALISSPDIPSPRRVPRRYP